MLLLSGGVSGAQPALAIDLAEVADDQDLLLRVHGSVGNGALGVPVAGGFDTDGDGFEDYALAAMRASPLGRPGAGQVFLALGDGRVNGAIDSAVPQPRILEILGDGPSEATGSEIWMDDVTGDGVGDLLIARQNFTPEPGRIGAGALSILIGGPALRERAAELAPLDLRAPPDSLRLITFVGAAPLSRLGIWMRTGDVTGDGIADIVIAADQEGSPAEPHHGAAYLIRGGPHLAASQTIDLGDPPGGLTTIAGGVLNRSFGEEILGGLDYDADGNADLFVGDLVGDGTPAQNRPFSGTGHVIYAAGSLENRSFRIDRLPADVAVSNFLGGAPGDIAADTAGHGDFDGDGLDDLAFSAPDGSPLGRSGAGTVYILHGQDGHWPPLVDLRPGSLPPSDEIRITEVHGAKGGVTIHIRPFSQIHRARRAGAKPIWVAILGSPSLTIASVDTDSLRFGPAGAEPAFIPTRGWFRRQIRRDVDRDGRTDLVIGFRLRETGLSADDRRACLSGTVDGAAFRACETIPVRRIGQRGWHGRRGLVR